jgi:hypothetical protein
MSCFFVSENSRGGPMKKIQRLTTGRIYFNGLGWREFALMKFEYIASTRILKIKKVFSRKAENP